MKRAAITIVGLLVGMSALAPVAAAENGIVILLFASPPGKGTGETITINVEAYQNGVLTDMDTIDVMVGADMLTVTNVSAGKYTATHQLTADDTQYGTLSYYATADLGSASTMAFATYSTANAGPAPDDWEVKTRIVGHPNGGIEVAGGSNVVVEARSYLGGALTDGGQVNFSVIQSSMGFTGFGTTGTPSTSTKVSAGVYQTTIAVPAAGNITAIFMVTAKLGTGTSAPEDESIFFTNPFRVMAIVESATPTSGTLKVWAGSDTPISGANVSLTGMAITYTGFIPTVTQLGPFNAQTDASGIARVTATWSGSQTLTTWNLNVSAGGKLAMAIVTFPSSGSSWTPLPTAGVGCEVTLRTDPGTIKPSQSASLVLRVTSGGTAVSSQTIARFAYLDGAASSAAAGTVTTDATGDFTLTWTAPADWGSDSDLIVMVECPDGQEGTAHITGTGNFLTQGKDLRVTATANAGAVTVTATYTGTAPLTGAVAYAAIIPGNASTTAGVGLAGGGIVAPLTLSGSAATGTLTVPGWLGAGDYTVLAMISNEAATSSSQSEHTDFNSTTVRVTPQSGGNNNGGTGNNNTQPAGGFIPGFDGVAGAVALAGVGAVAVAARRRRVE